MLCFAGSSCVGSTAGRDCPRSWSEAAGSPAGLTSSLASACSGPAIWSHAIPVQPISCRAAWWRPLRCWAQPAHAASISWRMVAKGSAEHGLRSRGMLMQLFLISGSGLRLRKRTMMWQSS